MALSQIRTAVEENGRQRLTFDQGRAVLSTEFPVTGTLLIIAPGQDMDVLGAQLGFRLSEMATASCCSRVGWSALPDGAGLAVKVLSKEAQTAKSIFLECVATARRHFLGANPPVSRNR